MNARTLSVSQLNDYIKGVFEDELILQNITLFGEIFEFRVAGKNTYLTLREGNSYLECMHFGAIQNFVVGAKVKLFGSVSFFTKGGRVSFIFKSISLTGEGELYAQFLKLKAQLLSEGLFENKLVLPTFVNNIAIITSETGAVIHDFITTVYNRNNLGKIDIFPTRVQGVMAADEIVLAIKLINSMPNKVLYDVIVIARGGGSETDLEVFNTEAVARAVYSSKIPIISAVGHQTDYTLCDYCASFRAGTPSIAGETIANINSKRVTQLIDVRNMLEQNFDQLFLNYERRLKNAVVVVIQKADMKIAISQQILKHNAHNLCSNMQNVLESKATKTTNLAQKSITLTNNLLDSSSQALTLLENSIDKNSPSRIFSKGYAKILFNNKQLTSINSIAAGDSINVYIQDGNFSAVVKNTRKY